MKIHLPSGISSRTTGKRILTVLSLAALMLPTASFRQPLLAQETSTQLPPLPESPIEIAVKNGTALRVSLKDLTKLALQNNLDIAISDTNEEFYQQKIVQAEGSYDPQLVIGLSTGQSQSPNTNLVNRSIQGNFNQFDSASWNFRFTQPLKTGGDIRYDFNTRRTNTNQQFALFNPQFRPDNTIILTQPLWRNLRIDRNRNTIKLANLDTKNNDSQFKQQVTDTIHRLQGYYWDLIGAIRDYEIKRESVRLAQITLENNKKKVEIGTLAPIGITEARADMSSREVEMIASEERIFTVENNIRQLISNDRSNDIWRLTIFPTETPEFSEVKADLDQAIDTALRNRPELEQSNIKLEKNDLNYQLDANERKWQLDLVTAFGSSGVAGPQFDSAGNPAEFNGGLWKAYNKLFTGGFTSWSVGFNLTIPLKNRTMDAQLAQLKIERRKELMNRKVTEQKIIVEIRNAVQAVETNKKRVETAKVARELAAEQLDGEEKRYQAGLSENFRVLGRQRDLSNAQGSELQALISYKKSLIDLQKGMYTLLEANDFEIAKTSSDSVPNLK